MATSFSDRATTSPGSITGRTYCSRTSSSGSFMCTRCVRTTRRSYFRLPAATMPLLVIPASVAGGLGMHRDALVDVSLHPQLRYQDPPEHQDVAGSTGQPPVKALNQSSGDIYAPAAARLGCEDLPHLRGSAAHPTDLRIGKSDLVPAQTVPLGHSTAHRSPIYGSSPSPFDLLIDRQAEDELHQLVVQKRNASFDREGHGILVLIAQEVGGGVGKHVVGQTAI